MVPAIIEAFWQICAFYDRKLGENLPNFEVLLEILLSKGNKIIAMDQSVVSSLFYNLDTQEILVNTNLFPQIANCIFDPYNEDFKANFLEVFLSPIKFEISKFIKINETPPVSSVEMPTLIHPSLLGQKVSNLHPLNIQVWTC